jgi:hypothetical protein
MEFCKKVYAGNFDSIEELVECFGNHYIQMVLDESFSAFCSSDNFQDISEKDRKDYIDIVRGLSHIVSNIAIQKFIPAAV